MHGGFPIKSAQDLAHTFDLRPRRLAVLVHRSRLDDGTLGDLRVAPPRRPDSSCTKARRTFPDRTGSGRSPLATRSRTWALSPTVVRALIPHGTDPPRGNDLGTLRVLGSTGEPWDPDSWWWYFREVGGGRCPVVNYSGGTEVSGGIVGCNLLSPDQAHFVQRPVPGDRRRRRRTRRGAGPRRGRRAGHSPAATRPDARLLERSGAISRDVLEPLARHLGPWRLGDRRRRRLLVHPRPFRRHAQGRRQAGRAGRSRGGGERPPVGRRGGGDRGARTRSRARRSSSSARCGAGETDGPELQAAIGRRVVEDLGKTLRPEAIVVVPALPKTRSGKIMRRVIRAAYLGLDPGDLSALEDASTIEAIRRGRSDDGILSPWSTPASRRTSCRWEELSAMVADLADSRPWRLST